MSPTPPSASHNAMRMIADWPDLQSARILRATDQATTIRGRSPEGTQVILKTRLDSHPYAVERHMTEVAVYDLLAADRPPGLRTARLLRADRHTLMLEHLDGQPVGEDRYPGPLPDRLVEQVLATLEALHEWRPSGRLTGWSRTRALDYLATVDRSPLTAADRDLAEQLIAVNARGRVEHGDPLPSNFLADGAGVAVVDFEHTGWHPAGTDWALLDLLWGPANPHLRHLLQQRARAEKVTIGYALSLLVFAAYEVHLHRTLFGPGEYARRSHLLLTNVGYARQLAHAVAGTLP